MRGRLFTLVIIASLSVPATAQQSLDGVVMKAEIEELPITGMMKITEKDGSVKYLSSDRRFVFVGTMYDLWRGEAITAGVETTQRIDWDRNGVSIEKIGFPIGKNFAAETLFIAPECDDCKALLRLALEKKKGQLNVVLLSSSTHGKWQNELVWCSKDRGHGLRTVYLEGQTPKASEIASSCDKFGLMLAEQASMLFGIGQLPMYVDAEGIGYTGEQAIYAVSQ